MLSIKNNFLFVHIPKTAGNAIQNILVHYSEDEISCQNPNQDGSERFSIVNSRYKLKKHSPLRQYKSEIEASIYKGLYKFACVRNPWERAISHYFSPHREKDRFDKGEFIQFFTSGNEIVKPMTYFIAEDESVPGSVDDLGLDFVIRFENLQADFDAVCDTIGIPRQALPVRNKSQRESEIMKYYDVETIEIIGERYKSDIRIFGYQPPTK